MPGKGVAPLPRGEEVPEARFCRAVTGKRALAKHSFRHDRADVVGNLSLDPSATTAGRSALSRPLE